MSSVQYRKLGNSGLRVSVPILGAGSFGSSEWAPWIVEEKEAIEIIKAAWDRGINTIDTANQYSNGSSEQIIGKFLKLHNIPRHKILIFSKCFFPVGTTPGIRTFEHPELSNTAEYVNQGGNSRAAIFNQIEASLKRLGTDYIDLYQLHRYDYDTPPEETMEALHDLVKAGKVRYIGASSMWTWQFANMNQIAERHGWTKFIAMQNDYSLLYREEEREMNAYCKYAGIGLIPYSPLASGFLARPLGTETARKKHEDNMVYATVLSDADRAIIGRVEEVSKKKKCTMSQVAIAWLLTKVTSPVMGINSVNRLDDAVDFDNDITAEEAAYLEELYVPKPVSGHQ
ncbi:Aldo/keto reductase [Sistotremastrum suecicum HHB10207 ss-3]|uniref:Aldo/keto reductase n=1 Tax=Sistotremastrum suecicum HHB10207 ss-3 TaxID=1314776 RepID=A0A166GDX2_9AGAM|nr:Aldo/keto reductase [Sistotremastrum suecicum HHB10207 ss-3]